MKKIDDLLPIIKRISLAHARICKDDGIDTKIYCGFRSLETQAVLYAKGRTTPGPKVTNAKPGKSFHQYGVAYDIVPIVEGKAIWDNDFLWRQIGLRGQSLGLDWGGAWKGFKDKVHFQFAGDLATDEMKNMEASELNAYLKGWLLGSGLMKTLELAEKDL